MEELEAKKRAKERLKKATMHREGQVFADQCFVQTSADHLRTTV